MLQLALNAKKMDSQEQSLVITTSSGVPNAGESSSIVNPSNESSSSSDGKSSSEENSSSNESSSSDSRSSSSDSEMEEEKDIDSDDSFKDKDYVPSPDEVLNSEIETAAATRYERSYSSKPSKRQKKKEMY